MTNFVRKLLTDAVNAGFTLECSYDGEVDYRGFNIDDAFKALTACDEMRLSLIKDGKDQSWALIIPELQPDEQIADYSGAWINEWWEANVQ